MFMSNKELINLKQKEINEWINRFFTKEALANPEIWNGIIMPHILKELGLSNETRKLNEDEKIVLFQFALKRYNVMKGYEEA